MTASDYPDWSAPQANANSIAATGVPLLTNPTAGTNQSFTVAAGGGNAQGPYAASQPSYEIVLSAVANGAGAASGISVEMQWTDVTFAVNLGLETYWLWPGAAGGAHQVIGKGPCKGEELGITVTNPSAVMSYLVNYTLYFRSNIYTRDDWRSTSYLTTSSGQTVAPSDPTSLVMCNLSVSGPTNTNIINELPLITGPCQICATTGSNTNDGIFVIQNSASTAAGGPGNTIAKWKSDANGLVVSQLVMPREQCRVVMENTNAATKTLTFSLIYQDQAS